MKNFYAPFFYSIDWRKSLRATVAFSLLFVCLAPVTAQDANEPNDDFGEATVLAFDDLSVEVEGTINPAGDQDYYRVDVPQSGVLVARITNVPAEMYPSIVLYNEDQTQMKTVSGSQGVTTSIVDRICASGVYYLRVSDRFSGDRGSDAYRLTVTLETTDVYECNDDFSTASPLELGDTAVATIRDEGDEDYYRIEVPRAGVVVAQVLNVPAEMYPRIVLYNNEQTALKTESGSQGITTNLAERVCSPGTYYLRVDDRFGGDRGDETYRFAISLDTTDINECNDRFTTATTIELGDTAVATIRDEGDEDYYRIEVPRAGVVVAQVLNVPAEMYPRIVLYDDGQTALKTESGSQGITTNLADRVCVPGTYYLRVDDRFSGDRGDATYRFAVNLDTTDSYECNDAFTSATLLELGDTVVATIRDEGDEDYYRIEVPRSGAIVAQVRNVPAEMYPRITLYDEGQTALGNSSGNQGMTISLADQLCNSGTYYLRVDDRFSGDRGSETYTFLVSLDTTDTYECNNDFNSAAEVTLCDTVFGSIFPSGDNDYYQVTAAAGDTIVLSFAGLQPAINYSIRGYDPGQNEVTLRQDNPGDSIFLFAQDSGAHYFRFMPRNSADFSQDPYSVLFSIPAGCGVGDTTPVSINTILTEGAMRLYPNPATDQVTVDYSDQLRGRSLALRILSVDGRELASYPRLQQGQSFDIGALPDGILLFQFRVEQEVATYRIVKQR